MTATSEIGIPGPNRVDWGVVVQVAVKIGSEIEGEDGKKLGKLGCFNVLSKESHKPYCEAEDGAPM